MTQKAYHRLVRLGSIASLGMLFQAGGCAIDTSGIATALVSTFSSLFVNSLVSGFLGTGF
jgi:hypothetical protein